MRKKLFLFVSLLLILPTVFTLSSQPVRPVSNLWIDEDGRGQVAEELKGSDDKPSQISLKASPETSALNPGENLTFTAPYGYVYSHPNLRIYVRVINNGDAAATFTRLAYYLSPDASITTDDIFLGDDYVSTLSIGGHSDEEIIVEVYDYPGDWYTGFIIDYWEESIEDNENDNIWCSSQFTILQPNLESYDFLILDHTGPDIEYITNVQNNSSVAVASSFDNYIYLSLDKNINPSQDYWIDSWTCPPLNPFEYKGPAGGTRHITLSSVPAGEYYLCWYIDATDAIVESDEDDNKIYINDPKITVVSTSVEEPAGGNTGTESFILYQNYPNPFNPSTEFQYFLPVKSHVQLTVHNMQGRIIRHLDSGIKPAGSYSATWDGCDVLKSPVSAGVYFIVLKAGDFTQMRKALLIR